MAMKVLARLWNAVIGASLLLSLPQACATQNEGERCDKFNGDLDCDPGLKCTSVGQDYEVCCPTGNSAATACIQSRGGGAGGTPNRADAADGAPDGDDADTGAE